MKKKLIIISCFIAFLGFIFGIIDYSRINNMEEPIFMIKATSGDAKVWHYIGIGYRMKRDVSSSIDEAYYLDNDVRFGLWFYTWDLNFKASVSYVYTVSVEESSKCSKSLYYGEEDRNIYLYCLDGIKINDGEKRMELKDYLSSEKKSIDDFIDMFLVSEVYKDGGTKLYRDFGDTSSVNGFTNIGLSILECNTLEGNRDIYLGSIDMDYEDSFCKFDDSMKEYNSFIRTYNVSSIRRDDDNNYIYLTLSSFQGEDNVEVRVLKGLANEVKMGYNYEFVFSYLDDDFNDNIRSIFDNTVVLEIRKTDKIGLEQVQEKFKVDKVVN